jgi:glycine cleavage system T protein (aminomethyltransferase)
MAVATIQLPGLKTPDPSWELYRVRAGGATVVPLQGDDRLTVRDPDGAQPAELAVLAPDGREDPAALDVSLDAAASIPAEFLTQLGAPAEVRCARLFGPDSPPGAQHTFRAEREAVAVIGAPAGRVIDGGWPGSDLVVEVRRAVPRSLEDVELPAPLAEPRLDFRVDRATAQSYEVRKGEYIQVLDVQGRQCSDFLAFNSGKLQRGLERGLDATTTRTLMGNAYPMPGLHGKFYDTDMDPLVEVVRDTVGRHDTFGLACTSKYYEDAGYFGHINCTDNFNRVVDPFGIPARRGWPALNFFYNTSFDADMILLADEPWSRPGDYVLLRASNDLVCASSACPDDIDPANAWECTDVHVRVYPASNRFSMAIAHRVTPESEPVLSKETAFHPRTSELTSSFVEYRGYWLPHCFNNEGAIAEYWACREKAVVMDLSPLRKWEILGPDAEALMQRTVTRNIRRLAVGQVVYTALCNETGGMIDDATVFRLGDDNFRFVGGDAYDGVWLKQQAEKLGLKAFVKPSTDELHNVAVQGPSSRDLLRELIWTPKTQLGFSDLKWFRFCVGRIGDYDGIPVVVSRTGYSGELGYEVWCHPSDGVAVWDAIWEAGQPYGLKPLGLEALDVVRIEAGLIFAGYEFDDQVDPFEAGIGFTVALDHDEDFVGRAALEERRAHPQRRLVGLELSGNEVAGHGDFVYVGRQRVGVVTSGCRSPYRRKPVALCRMAVQYAEIGTEVEIGKLDGQQKRIPAEVVRFPFYDPDKTRPRS